MAVRRIVMDIAAAPGQDGATFYREVLGMDRVMGLGFITTWGATGMAAPPQISIASEGGSGAPVPDMSIEVDNLDEVLRRARAGGFEIIYPLTDEPWGVRRFFVRDPFGKIVNVLSHV